MDLESQEDQVDRDLARVPPRRCASCRARMIATSYTQYSLSHLIGVGRRHAFTCEACGATARIHAPASQVVHYSAFLGASWLMATGAWAWWLRAAVGLGMVFLCYELIADLFARRKHRPFGDGSGQC